MLSQGCGEEQQRAVGGTAALRACGLSEDPEEEPGAGATRSQWKWGLVARCSGGVNVEGAGPFSWTLALVHPGKELSPPGRPPMCVLGVGALWASEGLTAGLLEVGGLPLPPLHNTPTRACLYPVCWREVPGWAFQLARKRFR